MLTRVPINPTLVTSSSFNKSKADDSPQPSYYIPKLHDTKMKDGYGLQASYAKIIRCRPKEFLIEDPNKFIGIDVGDSTGISSIETPLRGLPREEYVIDKMCRLDKLTKIFEQSTPPPPILVVGYPCTIWRTTVGCRLVHVTDFLDELDGDPRFTDTKFCLVNECFSTQLAKQRCLDFFRPSPTNRRRTHSEQLQMIKSLTKEERELFSEKKQKYSANIILEFFINKLDPQKFDSTIKDLKSVYHAKEKRKEMRKQMKK